MSDNVGLSTPRGSGTSGYVQRNRAFIRPRDNAYATPSNPREFLAAQQKQQLSGRPRQPDQGILEHDRKRAIEVRVFALRDELEDKGELDDDAIDAQCDALRKKLTEESQRNGSGSNDSGNGNGRQRFKAHQVHEQARAKLIESERLRRALRINKDYEEGGHWRRQEEKQALKRKKEDDDDDGGAGARAGAEPERRGGDPDKRRRRYSDESDGGYSSYEEGEVAREGGRRPAAPLKSVERVDGDSHRRSADARGRSAQRDTRSPLPSRPRSVSDSRNGRGGSGRKSRSRSSRSRSFSRTPSHSPSRSRSRSRSWSRNRGRGRGGDGVQGRRRIPSLSKSPSRSRNASRDSRS